MVLKALTCFNSNSASLDVGRSLEMAELNFSVLLPSLSVISTSPERHTTGNNTSYVQDSPIHPRHTHTRYRTHPHSIQDAPTLSTGHTHTQYRTHPHSIQDTPTLDTGHTHTRYRTHPYSIQDTPTLNTGHTHTQYRTHPHSI